MGRRQLRRSRRTDRARGHRATVARHPSGSSRNQVRQHATHSAGSNRAVVHSPRRGWVAAVRRPHSAWEMGRRGFASVLSWVHRAPMNSGHRDTGHKFTCCGAFGWRESREATNSAPRSWFSTCCYAARRALTTANLHGRGRCGAAAPCRSERSERRLCKDPDTGSQARKALSTSVFLPLMIM